MIINPIIILGAPRSGTSLLFHILRTSQPLWSLPSEGFHIWNNISHPSCNDWKSEECSNIKNVSLEQKKLILKLYEEQIMPAWFWKRLDHGKIWKFSNTRMQKIERKLQGDLFIRLSKLLFYMNPARNITGKRLVDKSISNCLRLEVVRQIFPGARYLYIKRNGLDAIGSLINGWLNPSRFVTFTLPEPLNIKGYGGKDWKFVLPEGWREYNGRHLAEVCTWQWKTCHEKIIDFGEKYPDILVDIKLEELVDSPAEALKKVAEFTGLSYEKFSEYVEKMPVINADPNKNYNKFPFPEYINTIKDDIAPIMKKIGYDL